MIAGIILVTALLVLSSQYLEQLSAGSWHGITIATLLDIPADRAFTGWTLVDKVLQFFAYDIEIWIILVCASALVYWVADFTAEKFSILVRNHWRPPLPQPIA
jgi:hypothetical protein